MSMQQEQAYRPTIGELQLNCPDMLAIRHRPEPIPNDLFARLWRISPTWAWRLRHCDVRQFRNQLLQPSICIVGEARKWNSDYVFLQLCRECADLGNMGICGAFGYHAAIEAFCHHWEEAHAR